ncbi:MAG: hypothetical protein Tsb0014_15570 [Pleurocapsa sp.]
MSSDRVLAFVDSIGGVPLSKLYPAYRVLAQFGDRSNIQIVPSLVGACITVLEMQGCSITLLKLGDELLKLWGTSVKPPALRRGSKARATSTIFLYRTIL